MMRIPIATVVETVKNRLAVQGAMHALAADGRKPLLLNADNDNFLATEAWQYTLPLIKAIRPWVWKILMDSMGLVSGALQFEFHTHAARHKSLEPIIVQLGVSFLANSVLAQILATVDPDASGRFDIQARENMADIKSHMRQSALRASRLKLTHHYY